MSNLIQNGVMAVLISTRCNTPGPQQQSGAVLIVSLILLLVLTMAVLSANRGVVVQERATAAVRESNVVFQVAESALVEAESIIDGLDLSAFNAKGNQGLYSEGNGPANYLSDDVWKKGVTMAAQDVSKLAQNSGYNARYFIEHLGLMSLAGREISLEVKNNYNQKGVTPTANVYRIVVRAQGRDGAPVRLVSGYYSN